MNSIGLIPEDLHKYIYDVKQTFSFHFYFHVYTRHGISNKIVVIKRFMRELK